jgi:predicted PurR-regulated permease PerM
MGESQAGKTRRMQSIIFGAILLILFILVCRLFAPFVSVILWSVLFYIIFKPLFQKCTARCNIATLKGKIIRNTMAVVFSLSAVVLIVVPFSFVLFQLIVQVTDLIRQARDYLAEQSFSVNSILDEIGRAHV